MIVYVGDREFEYDMECIRRKLKCMHVDVNEIYEYSRGIIALKMGMSFEGLEVKLPVGFIDKDAFEAEYSFLRDELNRIVDEELPFLIERYRFCCEEDKRSLEMKVDERFSYINDLQLELYELFQLKKIDAREYYELLMPIYEEYIEVMDKPFFVEAA